MGRFVRKFLIALFCGVLGAGCSVKEDRSVCPCRLNLDFSRIDRSNVDSVVVTAVSGSDVVCSETVYSEAFGQNYVMLLPRSSHMKLSILSGPEGLVADYGAVKIPLGMDCPPVYMHTEVLNTDCESLNRVVTLKKNFCRLTIVVEDQKYFTFGLVVRGNVNGYLSDGTPSTGEFRHIVELNEGKYRVLLPRQLDDSLVLDVDDGTDVLKTFALGEYLRVSGYDWTEDDLKDITIRIDYARTNLTISVQGWDKVYEYDFVI